MSRHDDRHLPRADLARRRRRRGRAAARARRGGGHSGLELRHATTLDSHEIGGQVYDAIFCTGDGYYPRLYALHLLLRGELPAEYDSAAFHLNPDLRPAIERGSSAMAALLDADAAAAHAAAG